MAKNAYYLTTKGFNAEVVVAAPLTYTSQSTIANFVANAAEGELGIFNSKTGALISSTGSTIPTPVVAPTLVGSTTGGTLAAGTYYLKYSYTSSTGGESVASGESSVTTSGTTGSIQVNFPAGPANTIPKVYIGTGTGTEGQYFLGTANATTVIVTTATGTAGTPLTTATGTLTQPAPANTQIFIAQKRDGLLNQTVPFTVTPGSVTKTPYSAPVQDVWSLTGFPTAAQGQTYSIAIFDLTPANQPYPAFDYDYTLNGTDTVATALASFAARINDPTNPVNFPYGLIATATVTGGNTLVLTIVPGRSIRIATRGDIDYFTSTIVVTHTTQGQLGVGTSDNVSEVEGEGIIFSGVTTNYPAPTNALPSEFGTAKLFTVAGLTYNSFLISFYADERSPLPLERHFQKRFIALFTPSTGTTPDTAITAILGF